MIIMMIPGDPQEKASNLESIVIFWWSMKQFHLKIGIFTNDKFPL